MTYSRNQKEKVKVIITVFKKIALAWLSNWNKFPLGNINYLLVKIFSPGHPCSHRIFWHSQTSEKFLHLQISALCSYFPKRTPNTDTCINWTNDWLLYLCFISFFNLKMKTEFTWSNWSLQIPFLKIPCATSVRRWTWGKQITTYSVLKISLLY